jgi:hypothetical protein
MRSVVYGFFHDEFSNISNKFQILRWFLIYFIIDMITPFIYDPFFYYGPGVFFGTILDIEDFIVVLLFIVGPLYSYWNYDSESGIASLQAFGLYIFIFDWFINLIYELLFVDALFFFLGCLILLDYFYFYDEDEIIDEDEIY